MGITYAKIIPDFRDGSKSNDGEQSKNRYKVTTSSELDDEVTIYNHNFADLPQIGDPHPNPASTATVKRLVPIPTANRTTWYVDVIYNDAVESGDDLGQGSSEILVDSVTIDSWQEMYFPQFALDKKGGNFKIFRNTAEERIKYEDVRYHTQITISAQTKTPRFKEFLQWQNTVNDAVIKWLGFDFAMDQLLFETYRATSTGGDIWREDFIFKGKQIPDPRDTDSNNKRWGWQAILLDAGFNELIDGSYEPIMIQNEDGTYSNTPVTQEWPLDGEGRQLELAEVRQGNVNWLPFQTKARTSFALFNFDFVPFLEGKSKKVL